MLGKELSLEIGLTVSCIFSQTEAPKCLVINTGNHNSENTKLSTRHYTLHFMSVTIRATLFEYLLGEGYCVFAYIIFYFFFRVFQGGRNTLFPKEKKYIISILHRRKLIFTEVELPKITRLVRIEPRIDFLTT